jgi:hypothetical protein
MKIIECHKETSKWVGSSLWDNRNNSGLLGYNIKTNKIVYKKNNSKIWSDVKNQSLIITKLLNYLDEESGNLNDRKIKALIKKKPTFLKKSKTKKNTFLEKVKSKKIMFLSKLL